jgi:hypothetical protein
LDHGEGDVRHREAQSRERYLSMLVLGSAFGSLSEVRLVLEGGARDCMHAGHTCRCCGTN